MTFGQLVITFVLSSVVIYWLSGNISFMSPLHVNSRIAISMLFGTTKRQLGFSYILTKKYKERAEADVGLMFTAYNLRRIISILGGDLLITYLKGLYLNIIAVFAVLKLQISKFELPKSPKYLNLHFFKAPSKWLIFGQILNPIGGF